MRTACLLIQFCGCDARNRRQREPVAILNQWINQSTLYAWVSAGVVSPWRRASSFRGCPLDDALHAVSQVVYLFESTGTDRQSAMRCDRKRHLPSVVDRPRPSRSLDIAYNREMSSWYNLIPRGENVHMLYRCVEIFQLHFGLILTWRVFLTPSVASTGLTHPSSISHLAFIVIAEMTSMDSTGCLHLFSYDSSLAVIAENNEDRKRTVTTLDESVVSRIS